MTCICDFQRTCCGTGMLLCDTCGGDFCVCPCGGQRECPGCPDCEGGDDGYPEDDDA